MSPSTSVASSARSETTAAAPNPGRRPWTAAAGFGYVVLTYAGLALAPLPDLGSGRETVRKLLDAAQPPAYVAGGCAALLACLLLIAFTVGLTAPARRAGHASGAAVLAVSGAVLATGLISTAAALVGGVVLTRGVPSATAQALITGGSVATWLSVLGIAVAMAGICALGPSGTALPRWAGWVAGGLAVALAAAVPLAQTPLAHVPALVFDLWLLVIAVVLLRRGAGVAR